MSIFYHLPIFINNMKKIRFQTEYIENFLLKRNIILIGKYTGLKNKTKIQCKKCDYIWDGYIRNIKYLNQGCPNCSKKRVAEKARPSIENIKKIISDHNLLWLNTNYINAHSKIPCRCNICLHEWNTTLDRIKHNKKCPNCKKINLSKRKTLSQQEVEKYLLEKNIKLIDIYVSSTTPILCQCKYCNYIWKSSGLNYIKSFNSTCQNCNKKSSYSEKICRYIFENIFLEKFIKLRIPLKGIKGFNLELDGYSEKLGIAFEHNGPQHYNPKWFGKDENDIKEKFYIQKKNDELKYKWCQKNNVKLFIIKELGKYTKENNIKNIIVNQAKSLNVILPPLNDNIFKFKNINNIIFDAKSDLTEEEMG